MPCRARTSQPAIIFFDEIDGLAGVRDAAGAGSQGVGERVISQLLVEMDGLQAGCTHKHVLSLVSACLQIMGPFGRRPLGGAL